MELSTSYFATCTKAELILLEDLAQEHQQKLRVKHIETPHALQIVIETESEQLRDFIYFMLQRLRQQQRSLERTYGPLFGEYPARRSTPPPAA
ncbi:MAG: hypothetical protein VKN33_03300 [Candidatus Sericytochromatia bacterium]|nr:hypothetical protein [Candidatus Sericytochromatia bacterium]